MEEETHQNKSPLLPDTDEDHLSPRPRAQSKAWSQHSDALDKQKQNQKIEQVFQGMCAEERAGCFLKAMFSWIKPIIDVSAPN